jgi:hypothetical protein
MKTVAATRIVTTASRDPSGYRGEFWSERVIAHGKRASSVPSDVGRFPRRSLDCTRLWLRGRFRLTVVDNLEDPIYRVEFT